MALEQIVILPPMMLYGGKWFFNKELSKGREATPLRIITPISEPLVIEEYASELEIEKLAKRAGDHLINSYMLGPPTNFGFLTSRYQGIQFYHAEIDHLFHRTSKGSL